MIPRSISIALTAVAVLVAMARPAAAFKPVFTSKWGSTGSLPGQFDYPTGLACDAIGNVYVCDTGNNRIQKFTSGGTFVSQWPEAGGSIASDGTYLYVSGSASHNVRKYTTLGSLNNTWGSYGSGDNQFKGPAGLAARAGEIYVCDSGNRRIQVLNEFGFFVRRWSTDYVADQMIPSGVVVGSNNHVYVLARQVGVTWGGWVQEYTAAGLFVKRWGAGMLPFAIAIDGSDRVMTMDWYLGMVFVVDSGTGSLLGLFGSDGTGDGQLYWPGGIVGDGGEVYITDAMLNRVQRFGTLPTSFYPSLITKDQIRIGPLVRVHLEYENPSTQTVSQPLSGTMFPKPYGGYLPEFPVPVGQFSVPPLPPGAHFDVFADVPFDQLPPTAPLVLAGGGPAPGPCAPPGWSGGIDLVWNEGQVSARSEMLSGEVLVGPGSGYSYVRVITGCTPTDSFTWTFVGECPGFTATLVNQDRITPAPPHLPPGWNGWVALTADPGVLPGTQCCFGLLLLCDSNPSRMEVCARACDWSTVSVPPGDGGGGTFITGIAPNPASDATTIRFSLARESHVRLEVLDLAGRSVVTLWDGVLEAGAHEQAWEVARGRGGPLAAGVYFVRLRAGNEIARSKVFLTP